MRTIDADELIKVIQKRWGGVPLLSTKAIDQAGMIISDIDAQPTIDPWHYPSRGEYPTENGEYFVTVIRYKETGEMVVDTDVDRWNGFSWCYFEPIAWMPLPEPPKEEA